jgi:hypothetical protein
MTDPVKKTSVASSNDPRPKTLDEPSGNASIKRPGLAAEVRNTQTKTLADLIRQHNALDQVSQGQRSTLTHAGGVIRKSRGEAINSDLHGFFSFRASSRYRGLCKAGRPRSFPEGAPPRLICLTSMDASTFICPHDTIRMEDP